MYAFFGELLPPDYFGHQGIKVGNVLGFMMGPMAIFGALSTARSGLIATGASPALPDISGVADVPYLTSTAALEASEQGAQVLLLEKLRCMPSLKF